jgi:hypothetical protein
MSWRPPCVQPPLVIVLFATLKSRGDQIMISSLFALDEFFRVTSCAPQRIRDANERKFNGLSGVSQAAS